MYPTRSPSPSPLPSDTPPLDPELLAEIQSRLKSLDERVEDFQIQALLDIEGEGAEAGEYSTYLERCATIARVIADLREMRTTVGMDVANAFGKTTGIESKYSTNALKFSSDTVEKLIRLESTCLLGLQSLLTYACDAISWKNGQQGPSPSPSRTQPPSASPCARPTNVKGPDWICFQLFVQLMEQIRISSEQAAEPCPGISAFETALSSLWSPDAN